MNDARTRLRKMVSGYKLLRKAKAGTEIYDATIKQTAANEYLYRVTDKAKAVVSTGVATSLELARKAVRGNLIALGCNIPMSRKSEAISVTPPVATVLNLTVDPSSTTTGDNVVVTIQVLDQNDQPLANQTVNLSVDNSGSLAAPSVVTDANGLATTTLTDAVVETVTVSATCGALSDTAPVSFV